MKRFSFILLAFALISLSSCLREDSENVNQDRIWVHYELFYNANEDITRARATFRFGGITGTKLQLTDPSEVRFNGDVLPFKQGLAYYEDELAGFVSEGTFEFVDLDDNQYTNDVYINSIEFPETFGPIDQNAAFELSWEGTALDDNELVSVWLNGINEGDSQLFLQEGNGSTSIILGQNQLQNLPVGNTDAYIERTVSPAVQQAADVGALITGKYRGDQRTVEIQ
jgi:hypothetical protein